MEEAHDTPSEVHRVDGVILVDGPDGVATTLTPKAALETAQRLAEQANEALADPEAPVPGDEAEG